MNQGGRFKGLISTSSVLSVGLETSLSSERPSFLISDGMTVDATSILGRVDSFLCAANLFLAIQLL